MSILDTMAPSDDPKPSQLGAVLATVILIAIVVAFYVWPSGA